ncbi:MAG: hypothetical protein KAH32_09090 [Chlamydiia bacterium]|nr:hypothetical protein [Chlamydiia bacterium]
MSILYNKNSTPPQQNNNDLKKWDDIYRTSVQSGDKAKAAEALDNINRLTATQFGDSAGDVYDTRGWPVKALDYTTEGIDNIASKAKALSIFIPGASQFGIDLGAEFTKYPLTLARTGLTAVTGGGKGVKNKYKSDKDERNDNRSKSWNSLGTEAALAATGVGIGKAVKPLIKKIPKKVPKSEKLNGRVIQLNPRDQPKHAVKPFEWNSNPGKMERLDIYRERKGQYLLEQEIAAIKARMNTPEGVQRLARLHITPKDLDKLTANYDHSFKEVNASFSPYAGKINFGPKLLYDPGKMTMGSDRRGIVAHEFTHGLQKLHEDGLMRSAKNNRALDKFIDPEDMHKYDWEGDLYDTQLSKLMDAARLTPLDKQLGKVALAGEAKATKKLGSDKLLSPDVPDFKSNISGGKDYFVSGSNGREKLPYLAETRQKLVDNGIMSDTYEKMTPESMRKAYATYKDLPPNQHSDRLFNIIDPSTGTFRILAKVMNRLPATVAAGAGVANYDVQQEPVQQNRRGGILYKK